MNSNKKQILTVISVILLIVASFFSGLKMGNKGYAYSPTQFKIINEKNSPSTVDYSLLWNVIADLQDKYIDKPIDQQKVLYGAVQGAVAALGDPYTTFFDPQAYKDFNTQLSGSFEGIGAEMDKKDGNFYIVSTLDESPAKKSGLQAGDIVLKVNDQALDSSLSLDQVVNKIRGPKGTNVKLTVFRQSDSKQLDFNITRDTITVKSVTYSVKNDGNKKVEDIVLNQFGDDTSNLFAKAAQDAVNNKVDGIILDLRDDPGGYLQTAVDVVSYWADPGKVVVTEKHSDGTQNTYTAKGNNILAKIPTIVLINGGSASAAEITSGALHDYGFAKLVGTKSFGKGSVQQLIEIPVKDADTNSVENTGLKVTIAKWLTPNGVNINHNGLDPDVKVDLSANDAANNKDPQLDKAMELLK